jgi:hypothetical protein
MRSVGTNFQDYFLKMAPDLSVLDLVEQYYFNHSETFGELLSGVFSYQEFNPMAPSVNTGFYRAMFYVEVDEVNFPDSQLSFNGLFVDTEDDVNSDYTMFAYKNGYVMIAVSDNLLIIESKNSQEQSSASITKIIGVGF